MVTDRVIASLKEGKVVWRKTWKSGEAPTLPVSLSSGKTYRGWNCVWLWWMGDKYDSNIWGTYNQIKAKGGQIRSGEKANDQTVIYWSPKIICGGKGGDEGCGHFYNKSRASLSTHKCPKCKKAWDPKTDTQTLIVKEHKVFNTDQADWDEGKNPYKPSLKPVKPLTNGEVAIASLDLVSPYIEGEGITLKHGGNRAYYSPPMDLIKMPNQTDFINGEAYAMTLYHEVTHSTGHENRLNRKGVTDPIQFGSHNYSYEEMVAEIGSQMMGALVGHQTDATIENAKAYCQNWAEKLKEDPKLIINAAQSAQKAIDMILDYQEAVEECVLMECA